MTKYPTLNNEAIRQAILCELAQQGVEFAQVNVYENYSNEIHFIVHTHTLQGLNPKYVESTRVTNQIEADAFEMGGTNFGTKAKCPLCSGWYIVPAPDWIYMRDTFDMICYQCAEARCPDLLVKVNAANDAYLQNEGK